MVMSTFSIITINLVKFQIKYNSDSLETVMADPNRNQKAKLYPFLFRRLATLFTNMIRLKHIMITLTQMIIVCLN